MRRSSFLTAKKRQAFQKKVKEYYRAHGRDLPWRKTEDPYKILVSEIMLQQTQVGRVIEKYKAFVKAFPDIASLARASFPEVMRTWQGLGYNRRALALKRSAETLVSRYRGNVPSDKELLKGLPGIGEATACAVRAFAFNQPEVFLETNLRSVFIHEFFKGERDVRDEEILPLVEKTLDRRCPRLWYSALMDYGAFLKEKVPNPSRKSAHYKRQSRFEGSDRQIRGRIVRLLLKKNRIRKARLLQYLGSDGKRAETVLDRLCKEKLIRCLGGYVSL